MSDLTLRGSSGADQGGGIWSFGALALTRVTFSDCSAGYRGGAIYHGGTTLTLADCSFVGNSAEFVSESTSASGGAIFMNGGTATITGCLFQQNTANTYDRDNGSRLAYGGAIALATGVVATITNCSFEANKARGDDNGPTNTAWGGAIYTDATSTASIAHCTFARNLAASLTSQGFEVPLEGAGGAIFATTTDSVSVVNSIFSQNDAGMLGREVNRGVRSLGGNIFQYGASPARPSPNDQINTYVMILGPKPMGGPTRILVPAYDTKVRDTGVILAGLPTTDQRGAERTPKPDPGAYEFQGSIVAGYGNGLRFDGSDDTVFLPRIAALESQSSDTQSYTVQAWVRLIGTTGVNTIFYYGDPTSQGAFVLAYDADAEQLLFRGGSASTTVIVPVTKAAISHWWVHVAATYEQHLGNATATLYLNGAQIGRITGTGQTTYAPGAQVTIGSWGDEFKTFNGDINDVRLSSAVLAPAQLGGRLLPSADDPSLVGHWRFDETTGIGVRDSSGFGQDGMLYGTTFDAARVDTADTMHLSVLEDGQTDGLLPAYDGNGGALLFDVVEPPQYGSVTIDPNTGRAVYSPAQDSTYDDYFTYRVYSDASGWSDPDRVWARIAPVPDAPVFTSTPVKAATADALYAYDFAFSDPDYGDTLSVTAVNLPSWLSLAYSSGSGGRLVGVARNANAGPNVVVLRLSDGTHVVDQTFTITVTPVNHAPEFASTPPSNSATADSLYSYTIATTDVDGDPLVITAPLLPSWMTLVDHGDGTATLSGTPSNSDARPGDGTVDLRVSDGKLTVMQAFAILVFPINHAPAFPTPLPTSVNVGASFSKQLVATDVDGDPLSFSIDAGDLPSWLTFTDNGNGTATFAGTPPADAATSYVLNVHVSDGYSTADQNVSLTINHAPSLVSTPPPTARVGVPYSYLIQTTDANGDPLTISLVGNSSWLKLVDHGNGTATLSGTPWSKFVPGQASLLVSDGVLSTTQSVYVTVSPNQAPTFTVVPPPPVVMHVGQPYSQLIAVMDPEGDPVHFTSQLPTWLTLTDHGDGTATLWGTPPPGTQLEGYTRIIVSDGFATTDCDFIFALNYPPTFKDTPPTTALFDTLYSAVIETNDNVWPYRTITATGLPAWLTLTDHGDGTATLAGTPTDSVASSSTITLRVSDGHFVTEQTFDFSVLIPRFRLDEHGTLTIIGGVGRDEIQVWVRENQVRALVNGEVRNFPLAAVAGVVVYGLDDHDVINVNLRSIPAYVLGGGGNDTLNGADERDTFIGGSGNDSLSSGAGNDQLFGMSGHDYLIGGSGNDYFNGAEGNDVLIGNAGNDSLYGGAGNDTLFGKDGVFDLLDGGAGDDLATYDSRDVLLDLFSTPA